jgi:hypothetical protein
LALAVLTVLATVAPSRTASAQTAVSYAGNIRGSFTGTFSGDYVICIEPSSKLYFDAIFPQIGEVLATGTINPQNGQFSASAQNGDDFINVSGTAQINAADSAIIDATGTYSGQIQGFPVSGSFSGSGRREVAGAFSISGKVYFNATSPNDTTSASFPSPYANWFVRLFRGGKLVGITASGDDGTYSFTGRTDGEYEARVRPPGQFANPVHRVKIDGANVTDVNFRSNVIYVYVVDDFGAGVAGVAVRVSGTSNLGYKVDQTDSTDDTAKRAALKVGNGTFLVKPLPQDGFIFEPASRLVTVPGTGSAKPSIRVKFTRHIAPSTQKPSDTGF